MGARRVREYRSGGSGTCATEWRGGRRRTGGAALQRALSGELARPDRDRVEGGAEATRHTGLARPHGIILYGFLARSAAGGHGIVPGTALRDFAYLNPRPGALEPERDINPCASRIACDTLPEYDGRRQDPSLPGTAGGGIPGATETQRRRHHATRLASIRADCDRPRRWRQVAAPVKRLGEVMKAWRLKQNLGLRDAAKVLGVSATTLSRMERGLAMEGKSLATV